jgi:WD40 repeat protein
MAISAAYADEVWSVALSKDGKRLATGDTAGRVRLWEVGELDGEWRNLASWEGHTSLIWSVSLSADGQLIASGSADGTVQLWGGAHYAHLSTLRVARPYERMDITGLMGITEAQRASLLALGAVERGK